MAKITTKHLTAISPTVSFPQERDGWERKVPIISGADHADKGEDVELPQHRGQPLLHGTGSPVRQPGLRNLLGEELGHINSLRLCRSPVQGGGRSEIPSPLLLINEEDRPGPTLNLSQEPDLSCRQTNKLLDPSLSSVSPLDLSPR